MLWLTPECVVYGGNVYIRNTKVIDACCLNRVGLFCSGDESGWRSTLECIYLFMCKLFENGTCLLLAQKMQQRVKGSTQNIKKEMPISDIHEFFSMYLYPECFSWVFVPPAMRLNWPMQHQYFVRFWFFAHTSCETERKWSGKVLYLHISSFKSYAVGCYRTSYFSSVNRNLCICWFNLSLQVVMLSEIILGRRMSYD